MGQSGFKPVKADDCLVNESNEVYTTAYYRFPKYTSLSEIDLRGKRFDVKLAQLPSEKLSIEIARIKTRLDNLTNVAAYRIVVRCKNDVHATTDEDTRYLYRIICKAEIYDVERGRSRFVKLFTHGEPRSSAAIVFAAGDLYFSELDCSRTKGIYIGIQRLRRSAGNNNDDDDILCRQPYLDEQVARMMRGGYDSDVTLVCADGKEVAAHRLVLCVNNHAFGEMLGETPRKGNKLVVSFEEFDVSIVQKMLDFMYFGRFSENLTIAETLRLYAVAQKYDISGLLEECHEFLIFNLKSGNVDAVMKLVVLYNDFVLRKRLMGLVVQREQSEN